MRNIHYQFNKNANQHLVGKQINRSYQLPSYESQQKTSNSDFELESPLKEQQNRNEVKGGQCKQIKLISATQPVYQDPPYRESMITSQSLNVDSQNKENTLRKKGSFSQREIDSNEFIEKQPQQIQYSTVQVVPQSQIHYKISMTKKQELERIQENEDEKVYSSLQNTSTQHSREFRVASGNKTLKDIDGQIKEVLTSNRFQDLQNLLEESKNQLKNDVQVILNGLEYDQHLIQNKIKDLQEEYNIMVLRKSQNQEVDEERLLQIERNLQKQINYLQSLRFGLQQSQKNMYTPFQNQQIQINPPERILQNNKQDNHHTQTKQILNQKVQESYEGNKNEISQTLTLNAQKTPDLKYMYKTEDVKSLKVDDSTQTDHKSSSSTTQYNSRQNTRGGKVQSQQQQQPSLPQQKPEILRTQQQDLQIKQEQLPSTSTQIYNFLQDQQSIYQPISKKQIREQQLPDLYKKSKEQNEVRRQEARKQLELEEQKLNNLKISDIDIYRRTVSRSGRKQNDLKQVPSDNSLNPLNSRSKKCLSAMKSTHDRPQVQVQEEQDKEMLLKRLNNRKDFSSTIKGIFHTASKNRMVSNSPESITPNLHNVSINNTSIHNNSITDQDKYRYKANRTAQKLDLNEIKILPRDPVRKRANNYSFIDQRNKWNKTPDSSQNDISKIKRLDYSFNQFTPHKDSSQGNQTNHSNSISHQGTTLTNLPKFNPQQSEASILSNQNKSGGKNSQQYFNLNASKDSSSISQVLSKQPSQMSRQKRGISYHDQFDQTQNSYLHNQCSWKSKIDYMDQVKQKFNLKSSPENWRRIANDQDIDSDVKIEQLKQFSKMLGIKAKRKLQLSRVKSKNSKNQFFLNDELMEADELIINSIKAKLAIIDTVNKQYDQQISELGESLEQSVQNLDVSFSRENKK